MSKKIDKIDMSARRVDTVDWSGQYVEELAKNRHVNVACRSDRLDPYDLSKLVPKIDILVQTCRSDRLDRTTCRNPRPLSTHPKYMSTTRTSAVIHARKRAAANAIYRALPKLQSSPSVGTLGSQLSTSVWSATMSPAAFAANS